MQKPYSRQHLAGWQLWLIALLALPTGVLAHVLDVVQMPPGALSLTTAVELLEDPQRRLSLTDVQAPAHASRFVGGLAPSNGLPLGFTRSAYWFRITLGNSSDTPLTRMLVVDNPRISHVQAHLPDEHGHYQTISTGSDTPFDTRAYRNRNFVFPLTLPAHSEQVVYLRLASAVSLAVPLQLWTPQAFHAYERNDYLGQAWYFGMASAMILFNLMLFIALRERIYLLYITFVTSTACTLAIKNGMIPEWFWGGVNLQSNVVYYSAASLTVTALLLFMRHMLGTRQLMPRVDRLLRGLAGLYLLTPLAFALALQSLALMAILLYLSTVVLILTIVLVCAFKRQRSAYFFLGAFALLMLGAATINLRALGIVPTNAFTVDGMQLGSTLEMLLLAFALADRLNVMRRDKARVQAQLLEAQQQLVSSLQISERELEQRVMQRTDELQRLNRKLEALSLTDSLTGIANRRHFDMLLQQEWQRAQRTGQPLALGILDVDCFKDYNDRYGHLAGDTCLREVAQTLAASLSRSSDMVARFGGEEFVFISPLSDAQDALNIAQRIIRAVAELDLPHAGSALGYLTVSAGVVAMRPGPASSAQDLLRRADAALYQAKNNGRNRAELAAE